MNKTPHPTDDLFKNVKLNDVETAAYINSGSNYSLITKSFVESSIECLECSSTKKIKILEIDGDTFKTKMFLVEDNLSVNLLPSIIEGDDCWMQNVNVV